MRETHSRPQSPRSVSTAVETIYGGKRRALIGLGEFLGVSLIRLYLTF